MNTTSDAAGRTQPLWAPERWLEGDAFAPIVEINELALRHMKRRALGPAAAGFALLHELRELWRALDDSALQRAARCPYLLVDAGFGEAARWREARAMRVCDAERVAGIFRPEDTRELSLLVLTYAWHLARTQRIAARLVLGMSAVCADIVASLTLSQLTQLADRQSNWLEPRWMRRTGTWRLWLLAAIHGESRAIEQAQLRGLQMLAGEAWRTFPTERGGAPGR